MTEMRAFGSRHILMNSSIIS